MALSPLFYKTAPFSSQDSGLHPAVIFLHGRGTDENDLLGLTPDLDSRFFIASIRAPYRFPYGGYAWFELDDIGTVNIDQLLESRDALLRCIGDIQQKYSVDPQRIFLFGFSQGAMMSLTVSLSQPQKFKGIAAHSGLLLQHERLPYQWNTLTAISFFIAHGTHDPIVPVALGREAHQRLLEANAAVRYREYPMQHTISEESLHDIAAWMQELI
jgi:phospholipase/carboxylesterase